MISSFSNDFDFDSDDFFKKHSHHIELEGPPVMEIVVSLVVVLGLAVVLALCCKCCCSNKYKGRVLQPPPETPGPPVYPQQQYNTVTVPTAVVPGHVNVSAYPTNAAPYPTAAPYPGATPYPAAGYAGGAPYPAVAPCPPCPAPAPSAPHEQAFIGVAPPGWHPQALPPTYDQVMSSDVKHPPYNPYAPH